MSNVEPSSSDASPREAPETGENPDLFELPLADIDGLESFDEKPASAPPPPFPDAASRGPTPIPLPPTPKPAPQPALGSQSVRGRSPRGRRRSFSVFC